ncbi:MAG: HAD-IA family hydrolase [Cyanobacteria bacterium P01_A01_bin.135]
MTKRPEPQTIFLDGVGTLFGVKGRVGDIYSAIARPYGVETDPKALQTAFSESFSAAPEMAFPGAERAIIPEKEFDWWKQVAKDTFSRVGKLGGFDQFDTFFDELYRHFATAEPWVVYPDVPVALEAWQRQGIELGVISNFDSRLYHVLPALGLDRFFDSITISTDVGAAKPRPEVFEAALKKHSCPPERAWHIGDSKAQDYEGAMSAGLYGVLIER